MALMYIKSSIIPLTRIRANRTILSRPIVLASCSFSNPFSNSFLKDWMKRVDDLNENDRRLELVELKESICEQIPEQFHNTIDNMDDSNRVLSELDYLLVLYEPPLNPSKRIQVRNIIQRIIKSRNKWKQEEMDLIDYIITFYGCE